MSDKPMPTFNPDEFMRIARELETHIMTGFDEAKARTAIGRAYYAAFLHGREKILGRNPFLLTPYPPKEWHKRVQDAFVTLGKGSITNLLYGLHRRRIKADYRLNAQINLRDVQDSIQLADTTISKIKVV